MFRANKMRKNRKNQFKIIAACSVAIFSLASMIGGAYSWFTLVLKQAAETAPFVVVNTGFCDLYSVELIKFDYRTLTYGSGADEFTVVDYLNPQYGAVNNYLFNTETGTFGYEDNEHNWQNVSTMNTYDPVDLIFYGDDLINLNCNAVYQFTISSPQYTTINLNASVAKALDKVKESNELFLSSCVDYDVFTIDDLDDENPLFIEDEDTKLYYPSYKNKNTSLTANESIYYKISYLSSLKATHAHFYGSNENEISICGSTPVEFVYDSVQDMNFLTFYVNVNYATDVLASEMTRIYQGDIRAVYDFMFKFFFFGDEEGA